MLDLFETMARNRTSIMVLDRCAAELPEVAGEWFDGGRYTAVDLWCEYLWLRASALALPGEVDFLARTIVETIARVPDDLPLRSRTRRALEAHRRGGEFASEQLAPALRGSGPPAAYLDFETVSPPVPRFPGMRPFEPIASGGSPIDWK